MPSLLAFLAASLPILPRPRIESVWPAVGTSSIDSKDALPLLLEEPREVQVPQEDAAEDVVGQDFIVDSRGGGHRHPRVQGKKVVDAGGCRLDPLERGGREERRPRKRSSYPRGEDDRGTEIPKGRFEIAVVAAAFEEDVGKPRADRLQVDVPFARQDQDARLAHVTSCRFWNSERCQAPLSRIRFRIMTASQTST